MMKFQVLTIMKVLGKSNNGSYFGEGWESLKEQNSSDLKSKPEDYHHDTNSTCYGMNSSFSVFYLYLLSLALCHTIQECEAPTITSHKEDILLWLQSNSTDVGMYMIKQEVLGIMNWNKPSPVYTVGRIVKEEGFTVLWPPCYHCNLNPTDFKWNLVKQKIALKVLALFPS